MGNHSPIALWASCIRLRASTGMCDDAGNNSSTLRPKSYFLFGGGYSTPYYKWLCMALFDRGGGLSHKLFFYSRLYLALLPFLFPLSALFCFACFILIYFVFYTHIFMYFCVVALLFFRSALWFLSQDFTICGQINDHCEKENVKESFRAKCLTIRGQWRILLPRTGMIVQ